MEGGGVLDDLVVRSDRRVTTVYNLYKPSGAIKLRFVVLAADDESDFLTPPAEPQFDEFEPA